MLSSSRVQTFAAEETVLDQAVAMHAIFLIEDGAVRVERVDHETVIPLALLGVGEFFGEMSFVDGAVTSARIVAEQNSKIRIIDGAIVDDMTAADSGFSARLYRSIAAILAARLRLRSARFFTEHSWG